MLFVPFVIGAILLPFTVHSSKDIHAKRNSNYHGKGHLPDSIGYHYSPNVPDDLDSAVNYPKTHGSPRLTPDSNRAPHIPGSQDAFQDYTSSVTEQDPPASPPSVKDPSRRKLHAGRSPSLWKRGSALGSAPSHPDSSPPKLPELHLAYVNHTTVTNGTTANSTNSTKPAPTNPADFLNHIITVAHVSNGITLQAGLMNGSIPIEEVVDELLDLGSVKVIDLVNFKEDKITALVSKLKEVRQGVAAKNTTTPMEDRAFQWEEYRRRSESFGDVENLTGSTEYFTAVEKFRTDFNFTLFNATLKKIDDFGGSITFLLNDNNYELKRDRQYGFDILKDFSFDFRPLKELLSSVKRVDRTSYAALMDGPKTFKPIATMIELNVLRPQYKVLHSIDTENRIKSNIELASTPDAVRKASEEDMVTVLKFSERHVMRQQKKFTSGFPLGVAEMEQLEEDVKNQWLLEMTNSTELDKRSMVNSLRPIVIATETLSVVNKRLESTFPAANAQQRQMFMKFKEESFSIPTEAASAVGVFSKYKKCQNDGGQQTDDERTPGIEFMAKVKLVGDSLTALDEFSRALDLVQLENDVADFVGSFKFTDIKNESQSLAEIAEVVNGLKESGKLAKIQESVKSIKDKINGINLGNLESTLLPNLNNSFIQDDMFKEVISAETKVSSCLQKLKNESLLVTESIATIRKLRNLDEKLLETVQKTATSVAQFSATLASIKKIPDTMKKNVKNVTLELNNRSQSLNQSDAISHSASALRGVFGLVKLESSIGQLKDVDAIVNGEIAKVQATEDQEKLKTQWGDHKTDMDSLNAAIVKAEAFVKKIDVSMAQTLANYSAPLKELASIPDVKINAMEKSKVLEKLISLMPPAGRRRRAAADPKTQLLAAKAVLDQLAALDLQFSAGASGVQTAFKLFSNVLTKFFATQHISAPPPSSSGNSVGTGGVGSGGGSGSGSAAGKTSGGSSPVNKGKEPVDFPILAVVIPLVVMLLAGVAIGGVFYWQHKKRKNERLEEEKRRAKEFQDQQDADIERAEADEQRRKMDEERAKKDEERAKKEKRDAEERRKKDKQEAEEKRKDQEKIDKLAAEVKEREEKSLIRHEKEEEDEKRRLKEEEEEKQLNKERAQERKEKLIGDIKVWIFSQDHQDADKTARFYNATMDQVYVTTFDKANMTKSLGYLHKDKHRYDDTPCKPLTAVEVMVNEKRVPIHANWIPTHGHPHRFIATQGPLKNTREDFWAMCMYHNVDKIVMLCQNVEKDSAKCDVYFASYPPLQMDIGRFQITTQSRQLILKDNVIERKLLVKDTTGKFKETTVMHYQHVNWPDRDTPKRHADTFELMEIVKKSENPIVVHCSAGIGRTTAFIGTEYLAREVENDPTIELTEALKHLREHRWKGVQTRGQLYWMTLGAVYRLIKEYNFNMRMHTDLMKDFDRVIELLEGYEIVMKQVEERAAKEAIKKKAKKAKKDSKPKSTAEKKDADKTIGQ